MEKFFHNVGWDDMGRNRSEWIQGVYPDQFGIEEELIEVFHSVKAPYFEIGLMTCLLWKDIFVDFYSRKFLLGFEQCADDLGGLNMGTVNFHWNLTKNYITFGLIGLTVSDRYASIVPVGGISMSPTFNPHDDSSKRSLTRNYSFCSLLSS